MNSFEFVEDKNYFVEMLSNGDEEEFDKLFLILFDFRNPMVKRKELNVEKVKHFLLKEKTCVS